MLSKVDLNSLRLVSTLENENAIVCDTMRILMPMYLKQDVYEMICATRTVTS